MTNTEAHINWIKVRMSQYRQLRNRAKTLDLERTAERELHALQMELHRLSSI
jgi:hypothetical protein